MYFSCLKCVKCDRLFNSPFILPGSAELLFGTMPNIFAFEFKAKLEVEFRLHNCLLMDFREKDMDFQKIHTTFFFAKIYSLTIVYLIFDIIYSQLISKNCSYTVAFKKNF